MGVLTWTCTHQNCEKETVGPDCFLLETPFVRINIILVPIGPPPFLFLFFRKKKSRENRQLHPSRHVT